MCSFRTRPPRRARCTCMPSGLSGSRTRCITTSETSTGTSESWRRHRCAHPRMPTSRLAFLLSQQTHRPRPNKTHQVAYERCLELNADYASAHNNLGLLSITRGRFEEAQEAFDRALGIDPLLVSCQPDVPITTRTRTAPARLSTRAGAFQEILACRPALCDESRIGRIARGATWSNWVCCAPARSRRSQPR